MNKIQKRILIITGIIVAAIAIAYGLISQKMQTEKAHMFAPDTKKLTPQVYLISDTFVEMFLVKDSDSYIAIDAGNDVAHIRKQLKSLWVDTTKVKAVFLTHCDGDHTATINMFPKAKIYFSKDEEQMINGQTSRFLFTHNKLSRTDYTLLADNQIVQIGGTKVRSIATPGHTPGSMSYLVNDSLLFVGDAFGVQNGRIVKPNKTFTMDMETAVNSFPKVKNIPTAKYLFTAHKGFSIDYKHAVDTTMTAE